jgi:hypothetical protein
MFRLLSSVLLPLLFATSAAASTESAPYFTERTAPVIATDEFDYDSGWQPPNSGIQVRFTAHGGNSIYVGMGGDGFYDWDTQQISFEGFTEGGSFDVDFGIDIQSQVQFDILGTQWQGDLMPPITYGIFEAIVFDPYLLPGDSNRPAVLEGTVAPVTVLNVPLGIDLVIGSGNFQLAIGADVYAELLGNSITVESETESALVDAWDLAVSLGADPTSPLDIWATLEAYLYFEITLKLYPSVVLTVLGNNHTLAELELPIETPPVDETWIFEPVALSFAAPPDAGPSGETQGGNGDTQDDATTFSDCSCSSGAPAGSFSGHVAAALLILLGLRSSSTTTRSKRPDQTAHLLGRSQSTDC